MVKQLLEKTDLSIVRISKKGGFSYSSCFVRLFRKKVGTMPQQYWLEKKQPD